jgi:hypothetical protein
MSYTTITLTNDIKITLRTTPQVAARKSEHPYYQLYSYSCSHNIFHNKGRKNAETATK